MHWPRVHMTPYIQLLSGWLRRNKRSEPSLSHWPRKDFSKCHWQNWWCTVAVSQPKLWIECLQGRLVSTRRPSSDNIKLKAGQSSATYCILLFTYSLGLLFAGSNVGRGSWGGASCSQRHVISCSTVSHNHNDKRCRRRRLCPQSYFCPAHCVAICHAAVGSAEDVADDNRQGCATDHRRCPSKSRSCRRCFRPSAHQHRQSVAKFTSQPGCSTLKYPYCTPVVAV